MEFASDTTSGAAPDIMAAVAAANGGYVSSYGNDPLTDRVRAQVREIFEAPEAEVFLVTTGTVANALSMSLFCPPWGAIYCHSSAHAETDECGAPEMFIGGGKLVLIRGADGKIMPDAFQACLGTIPQGDVHHIQHGMLSLTNMTEAGTVYSPAEVAALTSIARSNGLKTHMDGSRFANALVSAGCTPAEMTWKAGIDVLSLGGTKNGCLGVEAVVLFDPARAWEFELRRKRGGQLMAKHRFLSAQMSAYLGDGLWLRLAAHANSMAALLEEGLMEVPGASLVYPRGGNILFVRLPRGVHRRAMAAGAHYNLVPFNQSREGPEDELLSARLVCSWSTTPADIEAFLSVIHRG